MPNHRHIYPNTGDDITFAIHNTLLVSILLLAKLFIKQRRCFRCLNLNFADREYHGSAVRRTAAPALFFLGTRATEIHQGKRKDSIHRWTRNGNRTWMTHPTERANVVDRANDEADHTSASTRRRNLGVPSTAVILRSVAFPLQPLRCSRDGYDISTTDNGSGRGTAAGAPRFDVSGGGEGRNDVCLGWGSGFVICAPGCGTCQVQRRDTRNADG
nr:hypothetical protein CFP56_64838 [Quercus suber]